MSTAWAGALVYFQPRFLLSGREGPRSRVPATHMETGTETLAPGFLLAQSLLLWALEERTRGWKAPLTFSLFQINIKKIKTTNHYLIFFVSILSSHMEPKRLQMPRSGQRRHHQAWRCAQRPERQGGSSARPSAARLTHSLALGAPSSLTTEPSTLAYAFVLKVHERRPTTQKAPVPRLPAGTVLTEGHPKRHREKCQHSGAQTNVNQNHETL